jgi:protein-tyrosine phosphatase
VESINILPAKPSQRTRAAFVNFLSSNDALDAQKACDGEIITDKVGNTFWLGCSLKQDASKKVDVRCQNYSVPSEIFDGFLFLGNRECLANEGELKRLGIDHVLSVISTTDENSINVPQWTQHLRLHALDSCKEDITKLFHPACSFIERTRAIAGRILVHCVAGRSRSVTIVLAYMMRHRQMTLDSAFSLVKSRRPYVWPNDAFWEQLQGEERRLLALPAVPPAENTRPKEAVGTQQRSPSVLVRAQLLEGSLSGEAAVA